MADALFRGVGVALITVFDEGGDVDSGATADLAARLVDAGVKGVVAAGSTGEAVSLSDDERTELVRAVRERVPADVPVLAGTGAPSARQAARLTSAAADSGADGFLVLSPPGRPDPTPYYEAVAAAADGLPVLAYHFTRMSQPGIAVGVVPGLPVQGMKDSSGDADRLLQVLETWDKPLYTGSASILALAGPVGCAGAILALANAEPELCIAAFEGDAGAQRKLVAANVASGRSFPNGIKELTAARFGTATVCRV